MRIGPGGGGSSKSERVYVSKSRIDPPERFLLWKGLEQRSQLRPAVPAGEGQAQRLQVAADGLELSDELPRRVVVEAVRRALAELFEALEGRTRLARKPRGLGLDDLPRKLARLVQVAGASQNGNQLDGRIGGRRQHVVRHRRDRLDRQPPDPRQVVVNVVLRQTELLEVAMHRSGGNTLIAERGDRGAGHPLGELATVLAENEAVVDVLGRRRAERGRQAPVQVLVRAVVVAADDVRDLEVGVVDDGRQMVGRRTVLAYECDPLVAIAE